MKRWFLVVAAMAIVGLSYTAFAEEGKATKDECVAKAQEAAALVKEIGLEAALEKIQDPQGPFVWKDTYIFCVDIETGIMKAHPVTPKLVGKNLKGVKDVTGKMFVIEYINLAREKGEGWISYMWPKPGEKKPSPKLTYVYRVPDEGVLMAAGIYE